MTRLLAALAVLAGAATLALPAGAKDGRSATGVLSLASPASVTVQTATSSVKCGLAKKSPSLAGYSVGDRVRIDCARVGRRLLLARISHLLQKSTASSNDSATPVKFGGTVTALSDTSLTVHDGDRDLTCTIGDTSPSLDGLKVGAHVNVACLDGALVAWAPVSTSAAGRAYTGKIASITDAAVSVLYAGGTATCTRTPTSPSVAGFSAGDYVLMGCTHDTGQLLLLKHATDGGSGGSGDSGGSGSSGDGGKTPPPPPPTPDVNQTTGGALTALTDGSVTVHNTEHGDLTCTRGDGSPSLDGFHVGDVVGMGCKDGLLLILVHR